MSRCAERSDRKTESESSKKSGFHHRGHRVRRESGRPERVRLDVLEVGVFEMGGIF